MTCSFCGRGEKAAHALFKAKANPKTRICNVCIERIMAVWLTQKHALDRPPKTAH